MNGFSTDSGRKEFNKEADFTLVADFEVPLEDAREILLPASSPIVLVTFLGTRLVSIEGDGDLDLPKTS